MNGRIKAILAAGAAAALALAGAYSALQRSYEAGRDRLDWRDISALSSSRGPLAAAAAVERRLKDHPNDALLHYYRARLHYEAGRAEEALAAADRAIALGYAQEISHLLKALAWGRLRGDYARQRELASKALSYDPTFDEAYLARAEAAYSLRDDAACAADAAAYSSLRPKETDGRELAMLCLERAGDLRGAEAEGLKIIKLKPDSHAAYWRLGRVYAAQGRHGSALKNFSEAIRLNPDRPAYYLDRAAACAALGDFSGEARDYEAALEWKEPAADAGNHRRLAAALHRTGELERGLAAADEAVRLDPGAAAGYELRGRLRAEYGDLGGARRDLRAAAALDPARAGELARLLPAGASKERQ